MIKLGAFDYRGCDYGGFYSECDYANVTTADSTVNVTTTVDVSTANLSTADVLGLGFRVWATIWNRIWVRV